MPRQIIRHSLELSVQLKILVGKNESLSIGVWHQWTRSRTPVFFNMLVRQKV